MAKIDFHHLEEKWRARWQAWAIDQTPESSKNPYYCLVMFAYPSGDIHMGHFRNYTIGDVVARYRRMAGFDVLHPFGWDAFGQPAEGAAIKHKIHPREWTLGNIQTGRKTLQRMGISYDWGREVLTCEPDYYKWTQWIFLLLYQRGLAYQAPALVNWCETCGTILADEQAQGGECWRCHNPVVKKWLERCWFFRYTEYAERLLGDIEKLTGWPENVRTMQRHWIGRSEGCEIEFAVEGTGEKFRIFTTRPDTLYGVTFMAIAPEHPFASALTKGTPQEHAVAEYIRKAVFKPERERTMAGEKDGIFTGRYAINPLSGEKVQLWVADYVVGNYGTGIVMGVPAHDQRDFEFARKYRISMKIVIQPPEGSLAAMAQAYVDPGVMVNSGPFTGSDSHEGARRVAAACAEKGLGGPKTNYRLRDWLISRQRYWGCPIPMVHCGRCGTVPVPEDQLPVVLPPDVTNFVPQGRSPLADSPKYMNTRCPRCGRDAERDPDTMDTFMDSSFYLFRYCDPRNEKQPWRIEEVKRWLPVNLYVGGVEHACGHLMYFRFITKVLYDAGWLAVDEPVVRLFNHGMVCDARGEIMSKSKGNVVAPGDVLDKWGIDVARIAMLFFAPSEDQIKWSEDGLVGAHRFLARIWERVHAAASMKEEGEASRPLARKLHQTIHRVTQGMEEDLHYNTAISALMEFLNVWNENERQGVRQVAQTLVQLLAPMVPFMAEELWELLGHSESIFKSRWPVFDPAMAKEEEIEIVIQVAGKVRGRFVTTPGSTEEELRRRALDQEVIRTTLGGREPRKVIVVKDRLVNVVP